MSCFNDFGPKNASFFNFLLECILFMIIKLKYSQTQFTFKDLLEVRMINSQKQK